MSAFRLTSTGLEKSAIVVTPFVALAVLALGLEVGTSSPRTLGARVFAGRPGLGRDGMALQLVTLAVDQGVTEVVPTQPLSLLGSAGGASARWQGATNDEGVAEAWLDLPRLKAGDPVTVEVVTAKGAGRLLTLAAGTFSSPVLRPASPRPDAPVEASRMTGPVSLDVFVYGGRLVPGAWQSVLVRARDATTGRAAAFVTVEAAPEPGLSVESPFAVTSVGGWSSTNVKAEFLTASWTLTATSAGGLLDAASSWAGALPVSPGAATVRLPRSIAAHAPLTLDFEVPVASPRLYVDVDDGSGQDFAAALEVTRGASAGHATAVIPALAPGVYWLITSPDAHGAETLAVAGSGTIARPFRVGPEPPDPGEPELASLARRRPPNAERPLVFDGLAGLSQRRDAVRRRGLRIATGALVVAATLQTLLLVRAAGRTRRRRAALSDATGDAGATPLRARAYGEGAMALDVAILLLATLLGFALLAALLRVGDA